MHSAEPFRLLIEATDRQEQSLEAVTSIHQAEQTAAIEAHDDDRAAEARRMINLHAGQLEVVRAIRDLASRAQGAGVASFTEVVGAMENSYLTLERQYQDQERRQQAAFRAALAGGSRSAYERETDELNVASGRFTEIGDRLREARSYS